MVNRPLEDRRPVGPLINIDTESETVEQTETVEKSTDDPILETAENWYQSISKEQNKRKMMKNYLMSVTDLSEQEVENKLEEAGL